MDQTMQQEIDAAVTWWTDRLKGSTKRDIHNLLTDPPEAGPAILVARRSGATLADDATVERFGEALRVMLQERVAACPPTRQPDSYYWVGANIRMAVDYDPQWLIHDAWEAAGGDYHQGILVFPHKVSMEMNPGSVVVIGWQGSKVIYPT